MKLSQTQIEHILQQAQEMQEAYQQNPSLKGETDEAKNARIALCHQQFAFAWQGNVASLPENDLLQQAVMLMLTVAFGQRERAELQGLETLQKKLDVELQELTEALEIGTWGKVGEESGDVRYYLLYAETVCQISQCKIPPWVVEGQQALEQLVKSYGLTPLAMLMALVSKFRLRAIFEKTEELKERERAAICAAWGVDPMARLP